MAGIDIKAVAKVALALDEAADQLLEMLGLQDPDAGGNEEAPPAPPAAKPAPPAAKPAAPAKPAVKDQPGKVAKGLIPVIFQAPGTHTNELLADTPWAGK